MPQSIDSDRQQDEKTSVSSAASYQELDEKAIERLQKIREEGLAKAIQEEEEDSTSSLEVEGEDESADSEE